MFNPRSVCFALGSIFVIGLLSFTDNPLAGSSRLFVTNTMHNLIHLRTGAGFLFGAFRFPGHAQTTIKIISWAYLPVAILGFLWPGDLLLGLVRINDPDRWLHLALAASILTLAYLPWSDPDKIRRKGRLA
jgi:hypothetical protein